ncbi:MAG: glycosyl hydrolase, partial [Isosphaeraceae bacterium]
WRKVEGFPFLNVPEHVYVSDIEASHTEPNTVYACLDHHQNGDFKPYVLKSVDRGKNWVLISSNLPERGTAYTIAVDHRSPDLLFVGTEFGVFTSLNGGRNWLPLKGGMPPIAVRDLEIQRRENDLVVGTFGRGIYILDDYTPLRGMTKEALDKSATIFPVKSALLFIPASPMAGGEKAYQGASLFTAPNPPYGATFTIHVKSSIETRKAKRKTQERRLDREGKDVGYPKWEDLKAEDRELAQANLLEILDSEGKVVRRLPAPGTAGLHRLTWDFRLPGYRPFRDSAPSRGGDPDEGFGGGGSRGPLALPGKYQVKLVRRDETGTTDLSSPVSFEVEPLNLASLPVADRAAVLAFARQTGELQRAAFGTAEALEEGLAQVATMQRIIASTSSLPLSLTKEARALELKLIDLREFFTGDPTRPTRNEPAPVGLLDRIETIVGGHWSTTSAPTSSHRKNYQIAAEEFADALAKLRPLLETDLPALHEKLEAAGAPWAPGRKLPQWKK